MTKNYLIILCFLLPTGLFAQQNLVPNPSFEDTTSCPYWVGNFFAEHWYSPTYGSPDLFHICSSGQLGVPQNVFGWQHARTGNAYAGGHASDFSGNNGREYIQCKLTEPLEAGKKYEVNFWVSRADSATKACDNIGAYFSTIPVSATNAYNLPYTPQVVSHLNNPVTDAINWVQVIDTITAIGGEQYLTIGVFTDDNNTYWVPVSGGWMDEPYYYIDDVSVLKIVSTSIDETSANNISIFPNPSTGEFRISSNERIKSYTIYSALGQSIKNNIVNSQNFQIKLENHSTGIYFLIIETNSFLTTKKIIINH
ncbi:MAG: T9SS type A sorting domain-containing protein [Flavobacteriales bacterium]|nr:T9SS type A sorting domain-containing protein [Flavobacteriales bacterium]